MSLVMLLLILVTIGVVTYLVCAFIPMDEGIRRVIRIAAVIIAVLFVIAAIFGGANIGNVRVPQIH